MYEGLDAKGEADQIGRVTNFCIYQKAREMGYKGSQTDFESQAREGILDPTSIGVWSARDDLPRKTLRGGCFLTIGVLSLPTLISASYEAPAVAGLAALLAGGYAFWSHKENQRNYELDVRMLLNANSILGK